LTQREGFPYLARLQSLKIGAPPGYLHLSPSSPTTTLNTMSRPSDRRSTAFVLAAVILTACAPTPPAARPAPEVGAGNVRATATATAKPAAPTKTPAVAAPDEAPPAWHRLDFDKDGIYGTGVDRALTELLAGRRPTRRVVVAVIDGGVDTSHAQIAPVLWRNAQEIAGNGVDDDRNGFVDDVRGWSMIPALPGDTGRYDTMELTRLYAACRGLPAGRGIARPADEKCANLSRDFSRSSGEFAQMHGQLTAIRGMFVSVTAQLRKALATDTLTKAKVGTFTPANPQDANAKSMWLRLAGAGIDSAALVEAEGQLAGSKFQLDTLFDPRDRPHDANGSADVQGPDAMHGTHVAGIIGAVASADSPARGLASSVAIMTLRAVPDGDERDPDVARAIRYAVDNGAQVINMSFGKGYSPGKPAVDSAVRYAAARGVLLIHAAGNDGANNDSVPSFPSRRLATGDESPLWLEIGASSWKVGKDLPAEFSNYGRGSVDLFAPGVDITSTVPGGKTAEESGTSMAAPVVTGVAALLLSYFPSLTPEQVRGILIETARPLRDLEVATPGSGDKVKFGTLSRAGGVLDAYAAVRRALEVTKPVP